jgi:hypothetical protein
MNKTSEIFVGSMDLPNYQTHSQYWQRMLRLLKRNGAYAKDHLYTGVADIPWKQLIENRGDSPDRKSLFAFTEETFEAHDTIFKYMLAGEDFSIDPAIIVYNPAFFTYFFNNEYQLNEGLYIKDSVRAIIRGRFV